MKTKKRVIKYLGYVKKWYDHTYGNTYHSIRFVRVSDGKTLYVPMQYGYGEHYKTTIMPQLREKSWIPKRYWKDYTTSQYEMDNTHPIEWIVQEVTKTACEIHGEDPNVNN